MIIISHRGYWKDWNERNQRVALERSFDMGYGAEIDLRDICGEIVISHDMPQGNEITFEEVLKIMNGRNLPLALNIKADGQAKKIMELLQKYNHTNYFTFDMSVPEQVFQVKRGMNVYTGLSDLLKTPVLFDESVGIWLDCFESDWYDSEVIDALIAQEKKVCIVSADLHKRDTDYQWKIIKKCTSFNSDNLMLCTDYLEKAKEYFYGKN